MTWKSTWSQKGNYYDNLKKKKDQGETFRGIMGVRQPKQEYHEGVGKIEKNQKSCADRETKCERAQEGLWCAHKASRERNHWISHAHWNLGH